MPGPGLKYANDYFAKLDELYKPINDGYVKVYVGLVVTMGQLSVPGQPDILFRPFKELDPQTGSAVEHNTVLKIAAVNESDAIHLNAEGKMAPQVTNLFKTGLWNDKNPLETYFLFEDSSLGQDHIVYSTFPAQYIFAWIHGGAIQYRHKSDKLLGISVSASSKYDTIMDRTDPWVWRMYEQYLKTADKGWFGKYSQNEVDDAKTSIGKSVKSWAGNEVMEQPLPVPSTRPTLKLGPDDSYTPGPYDGTSQCTLYVDPTSQEVEAYVPGMMSERPFVATVPFPSDMAAVILEPGAFFRLGDVRLPLTVSPPVVTAISDPDLVPILRNRGTLKRTAGHITRQVDVSVMFTGIRNINGWTLDYTGNLIFDEKTNSYPVLSGLLMEHGGLRPLIALFRKVPFVPVINTTLNQEYGIHALAFVGMSITTIEEAPDTLEVTLSFLEFDYTAYLLDAEDFASMICWPLFGKYVYNGLCTAEETGYTSMSQDGKDVEDFKIQYGTAPPKLQPIPTLETVEGKNNYQPSYTLRGGVGFSIADEGTLRTIRDGSYKTPGQKALDDARAKAFEALRKAEIAAYGAHIPLDVYIHRTTNLTNSHSVLIRWLKVDKLDQPDVIWFISKIRAGNATYTAPIDPTLKSEYQTLAYDINTTLTQAGLTVPTETKWGQPNCSPAIFTKLLRKADALTPKVPDILTTMSTKSHGKMLMKDTNDLMQQNTFGPPAPLTKAKAAGVSKVVAAARQRAEAVKAAQLDWDKLMQEVAKDTITEEILPYQSWALPQETILQHVDVTMANVFSQLQLESREIPTLQYLGGQDTRVRLTFWGDRATADSLLRLQSEAQRLSREYRWIAAGAGPQHTKTSAGNIKNTKDMTRGQQLEVGFLRLDQEIANLCGVTSVLITAVNAQPVPEAPGRFEVVVECIDFDRTQKKHEMLNKVKAAKGMDGLGLHPLLEDQKDPNGANSDLAALHSRALMDQDQFQQMMYGIDLCPDLELPTYATVNAWVSELYTTLAGGGDSVKFPQPDERNAPGNTFESPTMATHYYAAPPAEDGQPNNALYNVMHVDPDFYITTSSTIADLLVEMLGKEQLDAQRYDEHGSGADCYITKPMSGTQKTLGPSGKSFTVSAPLGSTAHYNEGKPPTEGAKVQPNAPPTKLESTTASLTLGENSTAVDNYTAKIDGVQKVKQRVDASGKPIPPTKKEQKQQKLQSDQAEKANLWLAGLRADAYNYHEHNMMRIPELGGIGVGKEFVDTICDAYSITGKFRIQQVTEAIMEICYWLSHSHQLLQSYESGSHSLLLAMVATLNLESSFNYAAINNTTSDKSYQARGYIQLCGKGNYEKYSKAVPGLLQNPSLANSSVINAAKIFAAYFADHGINAHAMKNEWEFVRKAVLGAIVKNDYGKFCDFLQKAAAKLGWEGIYVQTPQGMLTRLATSEEEEIRNFRGTDALYGGMNFVESPLFAHMVDWYRYGCHGRLLRAFPTYWAVIINGGRVMGNLLLGDHFYGYNGVSSITVVKHREQAANLCLLEMSNVYGNLTNATAQRALDEGVRRNVGDALWYYVKAIATPPLDAADITKYEREVSGFFLAPGARLHVRMGYGNSPRNLPVLFNGVITDVPGGEGVVQVVAQGDGVELLSDVQALPNQKLGGFFHGSEPQDLLASTLAARGGAPPALGGVAISRFVNWIKRHAAAAVPGILNESPYGVYHFGNPFYRAGEETYGEVMHNIYRSNDKGAAPGSPMDYEVGRNIGEWLTMLGSFSWGQKEFSTDLYGKTVWDLCTLSAQVSPDYICQVVPFGFRSSLFFGKPFYNYIYDYDLQHFVTADKSGHILGTDPTDWKQFDAREANANKTCYPPNSGTRDRITSYGYLRKPFQQCYGVTSIDDILVNNITPSTEGMYTVVKGTYKANHIFGGNKGDANSDATDMTIPVFADYTIFPEMKKTAVVPTEIYLGKIDNAMQVFTNWDVHGNLPNNVATSVLQNYMRMMYQGNLTIIGVPSIKPFDVLVIDDLYNELHGPVGVREVVHALSLSSGFTSTVECDALASQQDARLLRNWNYYRTTCGQLALVRWQQYQDAQDLRTEDTLNIAEAVETLLNVAAEFQALGGPAFPAALKGLIHQYNTALSELQVAYPPIEINKVGRAIFQRKTDALLPTMVVGDGASTTLLDKERLNSPYPEDYYVHSLHTGGPANYTLHRLASILIGTDDTNDGLLDNLIKYCLGDSKDTNSAEGFFREIAGNGLATTSPEEYKELVTKLDEGYVARKKELEATLSNRVTGCWSWYADTIAAYQLTTGTAEQIKMSIATKLPAMPSDFRVEAGDEEILKLLATSATLMDVRLKRIPDKGHFDDVPAQIDMVSELYDLTRFLRQPKNKRCHQLDEVTDIIAEKHPELIPQGFWGLRSVAGNARQLSTTTTFRSVPTFLLSKEIFKRLILNKHVLKFIFRPIDKTKVGVVTKMWTGFKETKAGGWLKNVFSLFGEKSRTVREASLALKMDGAVLRFLRRIRHFTLRKTSAVIEGAKTAKEAVKKTQTVTKLMASYDKAAAGDKSLFGLVKSIRAFRNGANDGAKLLKAALTTSVIGAVVEVALSITIGNLANITSRFMRNLHAIQIVALRKHGAEYTAGINGHQGLVSGDKPHMIQSWFNNLAGEPQTKEEANWLGATLGVVAGVVGLNFPVVPQMTQSEKTGIDSIEDMFNTGEYREYYNTALSLMDRLGPLGTMLDCVYSVSGPSQL